MSRTNVGFVKRSDLRLRTAYPFLQTRVFELSPHRYVIYFDSKLLKAESIQEEFSQRLRFITANVFLTNTIPDEYVREIDGIADGVLSKGFQGMPFTRFDLFNVLSSKFPNFELASVSDVENGVNTVTARSNPTPQCLTDVTDFLSNLEVGEFRIAVDETAEVAVPPMRSDVLQIISYKLRRHVPAFVKEDDERWFDQIDAVYSGHVKPHTDFQQDKAGPSCYIDFSSGRQANLRQAIMMYDTVYVSLPIIEHQESWLEQRVSDEDFLDVVESGRVKVIVAQPEERCNMGLLNSVFERNPQALIGRRQASSVIIGDLAQTSREYKLNDSPIDENMIEISKALSESLRVPASETIEFLLWPKIALRKSLDFLMDRGLMGVAAISPGALFGKQLHRISGTDLELETLILGQNAQIAHAFNASLIAPESQPESWTWIANQVGDRLNYYRAFNTRIVAAWTGNQRRKEEKTAVMPYLPLFEFDADVSLREISQAAEPASLRREGRALISRLASLSVDERGAQIAELAKLLRSVKAKRVGLFSLESLEDAGPLIELAGAHASPPLFAAKNLLSRLLSVGRRSAKFDKIIDSIGHDLNKTFHINEDIDFLSKVDRVASLKRERIG